jgi:hypothetical protein
MNLNQRQFFIGSLIGTVIFEQFDFFEIRLLARKIKSGKHQENKLVHLKKRSKKPELFTENNHAPLSY